MSGPCLGEQLTALVDGALGHAERDRAHAHLARCAGCRDELEAQRALKARLGRFAGAAPPPPPALVRALRDLAAPGTDPLARPPVPVPARSGFTGPPGVRPGGPARPSAGPGRAAVRRARRASALGSGLLALSVGAALLLGGPDGARPSTPVDPGSDAFVVDFVSTTSEVPLADPASLTASLPRR
jgi:anti-sigma factor RsiW